MKNSNFKSKSCIFGIGNSFLLIQLLRSLKSETNQIVSFFLEIINVVNIKGKGNGIGNSLLLTISLSYLKSETNQIVSFCLEIINMWALPILNCFYVLKHLCLLIY